MVESSATSEVASISEIRIGPRSDRKPDRADGCRHAHHLPYRAATANLMQANLRWPDARASGAADRLTPSTRSPVCSAANASWSAYSAANALAGLPIPCPALVSTRSSTGPGPAWQCCSSAPNFSECAGTTRSSWSPVQIRVGGYDVPGAQPVQR